MNDRDLAVQIAEQAPEFRADLVFAIDAAFDLRGFDSVADPARYERLQAFRDVLTGEQAITASLDELLIRRAARAARPSAAAVRMSIDAPTMWGEGR